MIKSMCGVKLVDKCGVKLVEKSRTCSQGKGGLLF